MKENEKQKCYQSVFQFGIARSGRTASYVLGDNDVPPILLNDEKYYVFRMSMSLVDKMRFDRKLPKNIINKLCPTFTMAAKDRASAKIIMSEMIDNLFNAFENPQLYSHEVEKT